MAGLKSANILQADWAGVTTDLNTWGTGHAGAIRSMAATCAKTATAATPVQSGKIDILITTTHTTNHCTAGLTSYYAYDFTGGLGDTVGVQEGGTIRRVEMKTWRPGFGGWTFYFAGNSGKDYFFTHLDETDPNRAKLGQRVKAGDYVGRLTLSASKAALIGVAHVHVGSPGWPKPPPGSRDCPF
jgi:hypothetical protein